MKRSEVFTFLVLVACFWLYFAENYIWVHSKQELEVFEDNWSNSERAKAIHADIATVEINIILGLYMADIYIYIATRIKKTQKKEHLFLTVWQKEQIHPCKSYMSETVNNNGTTKERMTLVTAYFDIGTLPLKGYNKKQYKMWASAYKYLASPLVIFTDNEDFFSHMLSIRSFFSEITQIIIIDKKNLWPFQSLNAIKTIFSQPDYPKHPPNTMPEYAAVQHAKYALVAYAIKKQYLLSEFYAWIDIGYFRDIVNETRYYQLLPPVGLQKCMVAFNQMYPPQKRIKATDIFHQNQVWVGGGMFIGTANILLQFEVVYKKAFYFFLDHKLMSSDQQLLYALYSNLGRSVIKPDIEIQSYIPQKNKMIPWFYLGYHCRHVLPKTFCPFRDSTCSLS